MTKRELLEALEALECDDDVEVAFDGFKCKFEPIVYVQLVKNKTNNYISLYNDTTY